MATLTTHKNRLYAHVTPERFATLRERFDQFLINLDKDVPVIKVFDHLGQAQLEQLAVIREVSQVLQQKKEEDILKAKQAAEEAEKKAEAEAEKKEEEKKEDEKEGEQETKGNEKEVEPETKEGKETVAALYSQ